MTRAHVRLAERFGVLPFGTAERMTAAQVAIMAAALADDPKEPSSDDTTAGPMSAQPRVNRNIMLALARQHDPTVADVKS